MEIKKIEVMGFHRPERLDLDTYLDRWIDGRINHYMYLDEKAFQALSLPRLSEFIAKELSWARNEFEIMAKVYDE